MLILYIYYDYNIVANNITMTEAKSFVIRYEINQAIHTTNTSYIIVVTDTIHVAKKISNLLTHSYQM